MNINLISYSIIIASMLLGTVSVSIAWSIIANLFSYLNNLSCHAVIYLHCIISTGGTAFICWKMIQKHDADMLAHLENLNELLQEVEEEVEEEDAEEDIVEQEKDIDDEADEKNMTREDNNECLPESQEFLQESLTEDQLNTVINLYAIHLLEFYLRILTIGLRHVISFGQKFHKFIYKFSTWFVKNTVRE